MEDGENLLALEPIKDAPMSPAAAMASLALNFALKYHDINTVQDGALYQQYKLEGRNMRDLQLDMVFETAMRIEAHLLAAPNRLSEMIFEAVVDGVREGIEGEGPAEEAEEPEVESD